MTDVSSWVFIISCLTRVQKIPNDAGEVFWSFSKIKIIGYSK